LDGTGVEIPALAENDGYSSYLLTGTAITIGNYAIVPTGTPQLGTTYNFEYNGTLDITTNGTTFQLFGNAITQAQLLKKWTATCIYNGASWDVEILLGLNQTDVISSANIGAVITNSNIINGSINLGTKGIALSLDTAKIAALAVTTAKIDNLAVDSTKLAADSVITSKILDANVTNAKLATMADQTMKANISGGVASPSDVPVSTLFNSNAWKLTGNSGTVAGTNFIGTTDAVDLVFKVNSTIAGGINLTNQSASLGLFSLASNISGAQSSAFGAYSLQSLTTGDRNVGIGYASLRATTTGQENVGVGNQTLYVNTIGTNNTAIGTYSLVANTSGNSNTALGYDAAVANTTGALNIAIGVESLGSNTTGNSNISIGGASLTSNISGSNNTVIGDSADVSSPTSLNRIALGYGAIATADYQFAIPTDVTHLNFALNSHATGAILLSTSAGIATWSVPAIDTTAGDSATINAVAGRFRKDTSGTTFTLTNSYITANSIVLLQAVTVGITTGFDMAVVAGAGNATITFQTAGVAAAPSANMDVNFWVIN